MRSVGQGRTDGIIDMDGTTTLSQRKRTICAVAFVLRKRSVPKRLKVKPIYI